MAGLFVWFLRWPQMIFIQLIKITEIDLVVLKCEQS